MKTNIVKLLAVLAILGSLIAIAAVPASAAAGVVLSPDNGSVGQAVTVQATGFIEGQILTATFDGSAMGTSPAVVVVPASGNVNFTVTIPVTTAGEHTIRVYTDGINPIQKTFNVTPKVSISPISGPVGTNVTVTGTGFSGSGVTVSVTLGGQPLISGVLVDGTGSFSGSGAVAATLGAGGQDLYALDGAGKDYTKVDAFSVTPTLTITPNSGLAGSKVTITGKGWTAGAVTVKFAGQPWVTLAAADGQITNGANQQIPVNYPAGVYTVEATDSDPAIPKATTTFTVNARPLTLTPVSGPRGTTVLITGGQMTPSTTSPLNSKIDTASMDLVFGGIEWNPAVAGVDTDITIDSSGMISPATRNVPAGAQLGTNIVYAWDNGADFNDGTANDNLVAQGIFTVTTPTLSVSPATGAKNSAVVFTGSGWLPGAQVTITLAGSIVTCIPDGSGNIAASMNVPAAAVVGANQVTANDGTKGNIATPVAFTVPGAAIVVSPNSGAVGVSVTMTGSGFRGYSAITVKIDNTYQFMNQPLTDAVGAFTFTFTVPGFGEGTHAITANDGASTASAYFVISAAGASTASQTAGIASQLVRIWGYANGTWSMYDPADAAGSYLASLVAGSGYWINVSQACTLIYGGHSYALSAGWNLIGWMG